jgi:hypothetical protein
MKDGGKTIKPTARVDLYTLMEIFMMATGKTIRLTDLVSTLILMELVMRVTGKRINNMERD